MQSFAGRIHTKKFDQITPVLHELGLLTTEELLCLRGVPIIFKCLNGLAPNYLSTKFVNAQKLTRIALDRASLSAGSPPHSVPFVSWCLNIGTVFLMILETPPLLRFLKGVQA